ncbi:MAG: 50S ribosomal protein L21 [Alphaproteobacteria bacterium]|nr:MAG: 50S ribosomal protein L21 [Alphaproteobacteria bacterium]
MYAIVKTGGQQFKVSEGDVLRVNRRPEEPGSAVKIEEVLMLGNETGQVSVGAPVVAGASVSATVEAHTRGARILIFKKRRRQNSRRKNGHRQDYTMIKITGIQGKVA